MADDPLAGLELDADRWLCYPAVVGRLVVFVYIEQRFFGLGLSLANLFELADDEQVAAGPDAVLLYGVPAGALARFGQRPAVFFDDALHGLLVGALPLDDGFAYFGYLKKMALTLQSSQQLPAPTSAKQGINDHASIKEDGHDRARRLRRMDARSDSRRPYRPVRRASG